MLTATTAATVDSRGVRKNTQPNVSNQARGVSGPTDGDQPQLHRYDMSDPGFRSNQPRRETLTDQLVRELSGRILSGRYRPGERLPTEQEINDEFNVSRTVVREAIAHLRANGLVDTKRGVGAFVNEVRQAIAFHIEEASLDLIKEVLSVLELRIGIEEEAASLAAVRRSDAHLLEFDQAMDRMISAVTKGESAVESDIEFHHIIARATGNGHFVNMFKYLGELIIPRTRLQTFQLSPEGKAAYHSRLIDEHQAIALAIRQRDSDCARAALRTHLSGSRNRLRAAIERQERA